MVYTISPEHWEYRDEGGANIVMGYVGPENGLKCKVLRIRKGNIKESSDGTNEIKEIYMYTHAIVGKLFPEGLVDAGELLPITAEQVRELNLNINKNRPEKRMGVNVSEQVGFAGLQTDAGAAPPSWTPSDRAKITVELKPKWGFITDSKFVALEHQNAKYNTCRFCMHQHAKLSQHKVKHISPYCPMSLYSTELDRVSQACHDMLIEPQNNLKVYVNGEPGLLSTLPELGLSTEERLASFSKVMNKHGYGKDLHEDTAELFCRALTLIVCHSGVLQHIRTVQMLDVMDVEGYIKVYEAMMQEDPATVLDGMWGGEDWQAARDSALQTIKNATDGTAAEITDSVWQGWSMEEKACKIREFLISTTLKDCSVMITFQRVDDANKDSPSLVTDPETGVSVQYKVTVIDTDPKFFTNIPHYWKTDNSVVQTFIKSGSDRTCRR